MRCSHSFTASGSCIYCPMRRDRTGLYLPSGYVHTGLECGAL